MKLKKIIRQIWEFTADLIFPVECLGCRTEGLTVCPNCLEKISIKKSGELFEHPLVSLDKILSAGDYRDPLLRKMIHLFKFGLDESLAKPLADLLIKFIENSNITIDEWVVMPVPLNKKRLLERGFNQSELIGGFFAAHFHLKFLTEAVKRCRNTPHQVGLNKQEREKNLKGAFYTVSPNMVEKQNVILIDDVVTTGSTLEEIALILKLNKANKVIGLTVAKD